MSDPPDFQERCLLFLDVLGFSSLVRENRHHELLEILTEVNKQIDRSSKLEGGTKKIDFQATLFSDCIVASCVPNSDYSFELIASYASFLQSNFLWKGILSRGAIVIGTVFHEGNVIIGKAMVDAYRMESKEAFYPRVLLSEQYKTKLEKALSQYEEGNPTAAWRQNAIFIDEDGRAIVNPYHNMAATPVSESGVHRDVNIAPIIKKMRSMAKLQGEPAHAAKYEWMAKISERIGSDALYDTFFHVHKMP